MSHKSGIAPLYNDNQVLVVNDFEKSDILNNHFVNVGTVDNGILPAISKTYASNISTVYFDANNVKQIIGKLKTNSSPGPDGYPLIIFKTLVHQLAAPLSMLFCLIFQFGSLPDAWKYATVKPIFKKGDSSDPNNYRPISLTSVCCKIFETNIKNELLLYLNENSIITESQHGFISKHSTITNLIECANDWSNMLESKMSINVLYCDYEKAFDTVSIPKLLHKLSSYGVNGLLFQCIKSFLTDRFQSVQVGHAKSQLLPVISGVPRAAFLVLFSSFFL